MAEQWAYMVVTLRPRLSDKRRTFIRRYWYGDTIAAIAADNHTTESAVKMTLSRIRGELKTFLEKEGIAL